MTDAERKPFAKLFDSADLGQILVKQCSNDAGDPEVRIYFKPHDLGVCSVALVFSDTDPGWEQCDRAFEALDLGSSEKAVRHALAQIAPSAGDRHV